MSPQQEKEFRYVLKLLVGTRLDPATIDRLVQHVTAMLIDEHEVRYQEGYDDGALEHEDR